jgi:hypothetical protein
MASCTDYSPNCVPSSVDSSIQFDQARLKSKDFPFWSGSRNNVRRTRAGFHGNSWREYEYSVTCLTQAAWPNWAYFIQPHRRSHGSMRLDQTIAKRRDRGDSTSRGLFVSSRRFAANALGHLWWKLLAPKGHNRSLGCELRACFVT